MIGTQELLLILAILFLIFGADRLPRIARSLGVSVREFKKAIDGIEEDTESKPKG